MSTIYDVARLAHVSPKTVSRVLNHSVSVKAKTRAAVEAAIRDLDYHPSQVARNLRTGGSSSIGLLLEDAASGYHSRFHQAMLSACMEKGVHIVAEMFEGIYQKWQPHLDAFFEKTQINQMILLPTLCDYGLLRDYLKTRGVKCVLISPSNADKDFPSVSMNDHLAARQLTEYLLGLGHRRIAHLAGHPDHAASILRRLGYFEAFDLHNIPRPNPLYQRQGDYTFRTGFEGAEYLLGLKEPPTAIFAANDEMAAGVCSAAHRKGMRIPEDLSVFGFDDSSVAAVLWPSLSTVRQPYIEMSRMAIDLLGHGGGLPAGSAHNTVVPHELIFRDSCAPVSTA
jgi:LacI family transcriptional regulator